MKYKTCIDLLKWNFFFNVYYFRQATFFWQNLTHRKYYRCKKKKKKKKGREFFPSLQYLYFFLLSFLLFFNIVGHFYVSLLCEIRIYCISFSTLLKQYRLFIFHSCRYKNLIHIISFLFPYSTFSFYGKKKRDSLTPLNG